MNETEDIVEAARISRRIVLDLLRQVIALRERAERLEKYSDRAAATAARELAEYLESAAAEFK